MLGSRDENKAPVKQKVKLSVQKPKDEEEKAKSRPVQSAIPLSYYWLKDIVKQFASHKNFPDALAAAFATISVSIAFPFFPLLLLIPIIAVIFVLALLAPLLGLMILLFTTFLMLIYQVPLLVWILTIFASVSLILGYKHYRTITFIYTLIMLPLSYVGALFEVPAFIIGTLYIGFRRAIISAITIILLTCMLSGLTGISLSGPIVYQASAVHSALSSSPAIQFMTPTKSATNLGTFIPLLGSAFATLFSFNTTQNLFSGFSLAFIAMFYNTSIELIEITAWLIVVFAITSYVIKSRSEYKGTKASIFSLAILVTYLLLSFVASLSIDPFVILSVFITPLIIFSLEYNNIGIVKALEVMKQDFLGKFGEAFQELTSGTKETLDDVADYDETKKELREAILAPIEHREITGAYKVKSAKGILLFGPPGTGKTLLMRALSNEIRARFFYVKTSSLLSPFQGESSQMLSKIFSTAKKYAPAVLFFDEIDGIAASRTAPETGNERQLLSTLLAEMDGFQKIEGVVIVGSTNVPQLLDQGILRPGRFDKIIYMPLPDKSGRAKILEYYLKKLPIGDDINYQKLADLTNRYSGADIKNVCDEVARRVAEEAVKERKVLQITMSDIQKIIKLTKPSTSLARIDEYNTFKLDYERRSHPETIDTKESKVALTDVVGLKDAKKALSEAIEIPIMHPNLVMKYDIPEVRGVLLFGPPGTGKTMLMKAMSNEFEGVRLLILSGSEISRSGLERSLTTIKEIFNRAKENAPAIIFVDEMDAIMPDRSTASDFEIQIVSELLQQIDGIKNSSGIVLVGATNRPESIDPAFLRGGRFDRIIFTAPPGGAEREKLFENNLRKAPCASNIDFGKLASLTRGYTGADIANICRQVKMNALQSSVSTSKEKQIEMDDIIKAIQTLKPSAPEVVVGKFLNFLSLHGER